MSTEARRNPRSFFIFGLGLACFILAGLGASVTFSAMFSHQANRFLDDWKSSGKQPDERAWSIAHQAAENAIFWYPGKDAALYNSLGRIWEWKQFTAPIGDKSASESRLQALAAYRVATELRPTWPYTWIDLAQIKARLGHIDDEFASALDQALKAGPWRANALLRITEVGMLSWDSLSQDGRATVFSAMENGFQIDQRTANQLWLTAKKFNKQHKVCTALKNRTAWLAKPCKDF